MEIKLNQTASMALENILYLAATGLVVSTGLAALLGMLGTYYCNFQDGDSFQDGVAINANIESCRSR